MRTQFAALLSVSILSSFPFAAEVQAQNEYTGDMNIQLRIDTDGDGDLEIPTEEQAQDYFNRARCICNQTYNIRITLIDAPAVLPNRNFEIWTGRDCATELDREDRCERVNEGVSFDAIRAEDDAVPPLSVLDLVAPNGADCPTVEGESNIWVLYDETGDGDYEFSRNLLVEFDHELPPEVANISVSGGENAIVVEWDEPVGNSQDLDAYQVLCARTDGSISADDEFGGNPLFSTARALCSLNDPIPAPPMGGVSGSAPTAAALPSALANLDPAAICGEENSGTVRSVRANAINGQQYRVVLVTIDEAGNPRPLDLGIATPEPATDLWEYYQEAGGTAEGGFCFVATAAYDDYDHPYVKVLRDFRDQTLARTEAGQGFIDWYYENGPGWAAFLRRHPVARAGAAVALFPVVVAAAWWEYFSLLAKLLSLALLFVGFRWYRQKPKRAAAATVGAGIAIAILLLFSSSASAQTYWDEDEITEAGENNFRAHWNVELKAGPYYPDIDAEFGGDGPFRLVHGRRNLLMSKVEIDRFFFYPFGQLGLTASVGFSTRTSSALIDNGMGGPVIVNGEAEKSPDSTGFRLIPTTLGLVYRFTALDDKIGIPIVPYGKAALAYYLWWITAPDGSIASAPVVPGGERSKAKGGSLGFQGTVGLAIRLERLDKDAQMSLQNELGVEHAGLFVELVYANVDGFGSDDKLTVGDLTWFGGFNFEF